MNLANVRPIAFAFTAVGFLRWQWAGKSIGAKPELAVRNDVGGANQGNWGGQAKEIVAIAWMGN